MDITHLFKKTNSPVATIDLYSPLKGKLIALEDVNDQIISNGILGKGVAIIPEDTVVKSPIDGIIKAIFPTKHAIGIISKQGIEILIHIGINTVNLGGEFFETYVNIGQSVKKGTPIVSFNKDELIKKGYDLVTAVILTNSKENHIDCLLNKDHVTETDVIIRIKKC